MSTAIASLRAVRQLWTMTKSPSARGRRLTEDRMELASLAAAEQAQKARSSMGCLCPRLPAPRSQVHGASARQGTARRALTLRLERLLLRIPVEEPRRGGATVRQGWKRAVATENRELRLKRTPPRGGQDLVLLIARRLPALRHKSHARSRKPHPWPLLRALQANKFQAKKFQPGLLSHGRCDRHGLKRLIGSTCSCRKLRRKPTLHLLHGSRRSKQNQPMVRRVTVQEADRRFRVRRSGATLDLPVRTAAQAWNTAEQALSRHCRDHYPGCMIPALPVRAAARLLQLRRRLALLAHDR
mmetsp:Transcript_62733/g.115377  ORF Transcript_62733/g.115377 Transcript_62733/m.115377 type:complete len:299 (-) Transcript_62733:815-1711(-)